MKPLQAVWLAILGLSAVSGGGAERPNILWITSEDNGPQLGCYGDDYATTPNLDQLGRRGMIYRSAWSTAPVCAPARTAIISGMYPSSTGGEHMRSLTRLPEEAKMFPNYLREAGYYCSNNSKEDYNLEKTGAVWDESSAQAHYRKRAGNQPFFAVFNLTTTHESQVRKRPHEAQHDPAKVRVPAYHPDRPEVRRDWAQYYDQMTVMDAQAGTILRELEAAGLAEDTIVFYYGDHGPGMPRSKRCTYNSGLRVPIIVHVPERWRSAVGTGYTPGGTSDRLVAFVDLAPTVLSLAGIQPPAHMQGKAFLGAYATPAPDYLFGLRGRMDERIDMARSVFDGRYVYIRNYYLHRPWGQHVTYMFETPTTRVWKELYDAGQLNPAQSAFWEPKAAEELYDLETDPDEVRNLAGTEAHRAVLQRMRQAHLDHVRSIRDVGFLPEGEIHARAEGGAPYTMAQDPKRYPLKEILAMAELAATRDAEALPELRRALQANDSAVRFWAASGLLMRGAAAVESSRSELRSSLADSSPYVRVVAGEALGRYGDAADREKATEVLMTCADAGRSGAYAATAALNALDALGPPSDGLRRRIAALSTRDPSRPGRAGEYPARLVKTLTESRVLIVADEFPAMEVLAGALKARVPEGAVDSRIVSQDLMPADLTPYRAVYGYIHGVLKPGPEAAFIDYARQGGRLILLHHSISSGKRRNAEWFSFLGVELPTGEFAAGGYRWLEGVPLTVFALGANWVTDHATDWPEELTLPADAPGGGGKRRAVTFEDSEVYFNHVLRGEHTPLLGMQATVPETGRTVLQGTAGWYRPAGRGGVFYFMPGHSVKEFEDPVYQQILVNALLWETGEGR